jgi:methionine-S-sulfoxide reductase
MVLGMSVLKALIAAGCFWGVQFYFDQIPGVTKTTVGYTGGHTPNPSYEQVCSHITGHAEAVLVEYDTMLLDYRMLIRHFFRMHDPTQLNRQGPDIGNEYRSAIFYFDKNQQTTAENIKIVIQQETSTPVVTEIQPTGEFYVAEPYHQKFSERTGIGMCHVAYEPLPQS